MFNPLLIFNLLWGGVIFLYLIIDTVFYEFNVLTWWVVMIGLLGFSLGGGVLYILTLRKKESLMPIAYPYEKFVYFFIASYIFILVMYIPDVMDIIGGSVSSLEGVRLLVINDFVGERNLFKYIRFLYIGVAFSIFSLSFSYFLTRKLIALVFLIGLLSAILTTGRLALLLFLVSSSVLLYRNKIIRRKHVFLIAVLFVVLFFIVALLLNKGTAGKTLFESLEWNFQIYFMSSLACFNDFVVTNEQVVEGGVIVPNVIRGFLSSMFNISFPLKPDLNPFSYVPLPCNTYTFYYSLFHDGGILLVFTVMLLLGAGYQLLYSNYKKSASPVIYYIFSISLYPLLMTIFEDAYFSSPGFWMINLLPVIFYLGFIVFCRKISN